MSSPIGNKLLTVLADDGTLLRRSGTFLEDQERLWIVLDGRLVATPDGRVAYAAYRSGMLLVYDAEKDTLAAARETVEQGGFPDVVFRPTPGGELARVDPASPILTRSISAVGGELHLLAGITPAEGGRVFDVYDARDARYLYSYRFAGEAASACVTPGRVVAVSDSVVSVWGAER